MGPVERGLLECAANGTLSPQGRVSPLAQVYKTPGFPWVCVTCPVISTKLEYSGASSPPTSATSVTYSMAILICYLLFLTLPYLVYDAPNIPFDILNPICACPILDSKP